jgi:nucleoid-associated protein YgaU
MGNLEKLVVLTVFFLAAVVLAVSIDTGSPVSAAGSTPAEDLGRRLEVAERTVDAPLAAPADEETAGNGGARAADGPPLLSATGSREVPAGESAGGESPADRVATDRAPGELREIAGLVPTISERFWSYTCRSGDTYSSLARRLYGSNVYAEALRQANPDVLVLEAGVQLTVPADARPTPPRTQAAEARPVRSAPTRTVREPQASEDLDGRLGTEFREHTVARGETLSHIAQRYYGRSSLWRRIYDANRDVIESPDRVSEGTVLRVP